MENEFYRRRNDNIVNFEVMGGWPIHKMTIRDILEAFCEHSNGIYHIKDDNPLLDVYPRVFEDDGMNYGVNEKCVISFDPDKDKKNCNIFIEEEIKDLNLWDKSELYPFCDAKHKMTGKKYIVRPEIRDSSNGIEHLCICVNQKPEKEKGCQIIWIPENELKEIKEKR